MIVGATLPSARVRAGRSPSGSSDTCRMLYTGAQAANGSFFQKLLCTSLRGGQHGAGFLGKCGAADGGGAFESRSEARGQGSRPQRPASVSGLWKEGAGGGFGEVAGTRPVSAVPMARLPSGAVRASQPATERRRRSGAGLGGSPRRRSLLGLVRPDHDRKALARECPCGWARAVCSCAATGRRFAVRE